MRLKRICLAATLDDGSLYYRALLPARHCNPILRREGIELFVPLQGDDIKGCDAYVFLRAPDLRMFPWLRRLDVPVAFDLDDNVYQFPAWREIKANYRPWEMDLYSVLLAEVASRFVTTNERLRDAVNAFAPVADKTAILPNLIDCDAYPEPEPRPRESPVRVMWAGYESHSGDLPHVFPALRHVCQKYGDKVEVVFAGYCPKEIVADPVIRPLALGSVLTAHYPRFLALCRPTIGLAPLATTDDDLPFNTCKSPIKWMEFTMAGAEVVAQDMPPYSDVILQDGLSGYLATSSEHWAAVLDALVGKAIAFGTDNCDTCDLVRRDYSWQSPACRDRWLDFYRSLVN